MTDEVGPENRELTEILMPPQPIMPDISAELESENKALKHEW